MVVGQNSFSQKRPFLDPPAKKKLAKLQQVHKKKCAAHLGFYVGIYVAQKQGLDKGPPGVCSPVTLHSVAAALTNLCFAFKTLDVGLCSPSSASSYTSTPERLPSHLASWNLVMTSPQFRPPPAFTGRPSLAEFYLNFRQLSRKITHHPIFFAK